MVRLRPLIAVTGTIRVEGGEKNKMRTLADDDADDDAAEATTGANASEKFTIVQEREITDDRRRGNTISTSYMRDLRRIRLIKTPYGSLVSPDRLNDIKTLLLDATKDVAEFNKTSKTCRLRNCMLWERLSGNRLAAVEGWIAAEVKAGRIKTKVIKTISEETP